MKLLILMILVAVVYSQKTVPGCCVPSQWEGIQGTIIGRVEGSTPSVITENVQTAYDEKNQRMAFNVASDYSGSLQYLQIIQDYKAGKQYVINKDFQTCETNPLTTPFQPICLPKNAVPQGPYFFGTGNNKLEAISFIFNVSGVNVTVSALQDGCIPLIEVVISSIGSTSQMQTTGFVNITPGISDPSIFEVPSICKQAKHFEIPASKVFQRKWLLYA